MLGVVELLLGDVGYASDLLDGCLNDFLALSYKQKIRELQSQKV